VRWIQNANREGLGAIEDHPHPGRPPVVGEKMLEELDEALSKSPQDYGLSRSRWDDVMIVEYLKRFHYIKVNVPHAQRMIKKLGHSLCRRRQKTPSCQGKQL